MKTIDDSKTPAEPRFAGRSASPASAPAGERPIWLSVRANLPTAQRATRKCYPELASRLHKALGGLPSDALPPEDARHAPRPELTLALVQDALEARASDIHIEPGFERVRVRFRIDGALSDVAALTAEQGKWLSNQLKAVASLDPVVRFTPRDSHARLPVGDSAIDLRFALAPAQRGEVMAIRLLDSRRLQRSLDELGLPDETLAEIEDWIQNANGMFLAAGPTGCGKTTTIYSLLHELKFADRAVVSIEDPVEYEIAGITQVQLDEKHHLSFAEGVKAMLRLDPDFLMLGEIRDGASAHAAVDASITGRVLLSTVHARDAVGVITALRNWGLPDPEIAETLGVVVAQRLVRRLCPHCRTRALPEAVDERWLQAVGQPIPGQVWSAAGCSRCNGLGYHGRVGIFELWRLNEADYRAILAHTDERTLRASVHARSRSGLVRDGMSK